MATYRSFGRCVLLGAALLSMMVLAGGAGAQTYDPSPPAEPVKLIFIHHSCGENWLTDDHGGLGLVLAENNYFVSDTNYGWGPDSIGDRTDIPNWPEWFTGPESGRYLEALYTESGQNSWYTRELPDPGGENQIIMFKSCYPNSNLEGAPDDPPERAGDWLSVGNAKAVYNEILAYFATRPDKLFIAVTAPPVQDPEFGANARAFNNWLVNDWLDDYEGKNVAVFDFYNVLTGPDIHHRFQDSYIEHGWGVSNTAYYVSSGDDHPTATGNRKATEEFVPLLNVYYHLWQPEAPSGPPPAQDEGAVEAPTTEPVPTIALDAEPEPLVESPPILSDGWIDDFEGAGPEWVVFDDGSGETSVSCQSDPGDAYRGCCSLFIDYEVAAQNWGTCSLVFADSQDWEQGAGISLWLRAEQVGQPVIIAVYQGDSEAELSTFEYRLESGAEMVDGWQRVEIAWDQLVQPEWQGDASARFDPGRAMGMALVFEGDSGSGSLWVDDVSLLGTGTTTVESAVETAAGTEAESKPELVEAEEEAVSEVQDPEVEAEAETESEEEGGGTGICPGSTAIVLLALAGVVWTRGCTPAADGKRGS